MVFENQMVFENSWNRAASPTEMLIDPGSLMYSSKYLKCPDPGQRRPLPQAGEL